MRLSPHHSAEDLLVLARPGTALSLRLSEAMLLEAIVRHPNADIDVWRYVSKRSGYWAPQEFMAGHPEASMDPTVRQNIISWGHWGALRLLYPTVSQEEFGALLPQMFKATFCSTGRLLEAGLPADAAITEELVAGMRDNKHERPRAAAALLASFIGVRALPALDWSCSGCVVCDYDRTVASWQKVF